MKGGRPTWPQSAPLPFRLRARLIVFLFFPRPSVILRRILPGPSHRLASHPPSPFIATIVVMPAPFLLHMKGGRSTWPRSATLPFRFHVQLLWRKCRSNSPPLAPISFGLHPGKSPLPSPRINDDRRLPSRRPRHLLRVFSPFLWGVLISRPSLPGSRQPASHTLNLSPATIP